MTDDATDNFPKYPLPDVTLVEIRQKFGDWLDRVSNAKERVILTRHGTGIAAIVPFDDLGAIFAESSDVPPDQLAAYVLSGFPADATMEQAERWATQTGAMMARSCRNGQDGERRFFETWKLLARDPRAALNWMQAAADRASNSSKGLFVYALMRMLRRYRQLIVDSEVQNLRLLLASQSHRKSVFEKIIGLDWTKWPIPLIRDLGRKMEAELKPLTIAESGYHEERILAHLVCDLFMNVNGYEGLQIVPARWAFARTVSDIARPVNEKTKGADIRVTNHDVDEEVDKAGGEVIFRHVGYRAYANGAWLADIASAADTPAPVQKWIRRFVGGSVTQAQLLDRESLPIRSWILMKGGPVNYERTEFGILFKFLREKFQQSKTGFDLTSNEIPASAPDPNDVFEDFLLGRRSVLMGGSIHDLLLEDFWIGMNKTFVRIIDKTDFVGLNEYTQHPPGQNIILFSERLNERSEITNLICEIYRTLANGVVDVVENGPLESRHALLTYIATVLAPTFRESWITTLADRRWSFAGSSSALVQLLTNEMEVATAPQAAQTVDGQDQSRQQV